MNIKDMKDKINSKEYDILRNKKELGDNIILLTTGGSYAYGTDIHTKEHESDFDVRGICLNTYEEILTMNCIDRPYEDKELDLVIYPLKQIINLLVNVNPNVIEMLGTKDEHLFIQSKEGKLIRDNRELFLSQKAYASFGGYAIQQLRRLQNALARDEYPREEKERHILGSIEKQMSTFEDRYKGLSNERLKLYIDSNKNTNSQKEILIDFNLKGYPLRDLKGMLSEMNMVVRDYDKLNKRNSKKDTLHLNKHSMHLVRLLIMGKEILEGKGINTYREKDRELLLDIRNGMYTYNEIFSIVDKLEKDFKYAYENTALPEKAYINEIKELTIEINKSVVKSFESV